MLKKTVQIDQYYDSNPREEYDHACTIYYSVRDYALGDIKMSSEEFVDMLIADNENLAEYYYQNGDSAIEHINRYIEKQVKNGAYFFLPVYAYIHGGVTISLGSFSCPWDSGLAGYIYIDRETALHEGFDLATSEGKEWARRIMESEISEFDSYLRGEIYGFVIEDTETGEILDSCTGFFTESDAEQEAAASLQYWSNERELEHADFMHGLIQNA